jgi:hypothetical protein
MAPKTSTRSVRVQTANRQIAPDELQALVSRLLRRGSISPKLHILPRAYPSHSHGDQVEYSIARNGDNCSSTITFLDERSKKLAVSAWKEKSFDKADYDFDDVFDGLTILRAPDDGDIEYVFREWVHTPLSGPLANVSSIAYVPFMGSVATLWILSHPSRSFGCATSSLQFRPSKVHEL